MCRLEKYYLKKCHSRQEKQRARADYKIARNNFYKHLRKCQRNHKKNLINEIENINTANPKQFWNHIKSLGPHGKQEIPTTVMINGNHTSEIDTVMKKRNRRMILKTFTTNQIMMTMIIISMRMS